MKGGEALFFFPFPLLIKNNKTKIIVNNCSYSLETKKYLEDIDTC